MRALRVRIHILQHTRYRSVTDLYMPDVRQSGLSNFAAIHWLSTSVKHTDGTPGTEEVYFKKEWAHKLLAGMRD
jgi:hypothetical protein